MPYMKSKGKRGSSDLSNLMTEERMLEIANNKLKDCGNKMTSAQAIFYLQLVKYALSNGTQTKSKDGFVILLADKEMIKLFNQGKTFINNTLLAFEDAGVIERRSLTKAEKEKMFSDRGVSNCKVTKILMKNIVEQ